MFRVRFRQLHDQHTRKPTLMQRFRKAGLTG
jgi:hypothetical protein